jgi:hypothetical protein
MPDDEKKPEEKKIKNEFLIFKIDANPKINNSYKLLGYANSLSKANELISELSPMETGRIILVEKKGYFERKPTITLNEISENLINE